MFACVGFSERGVTRDNTGTVIHPLTVDLGTHVMAIVLTPACSVFSMRGVHLRHHRDNAERRHVSHTRQKMLLTPHPPEAADTATVVVRKLGGKWGWGAKVRHDAGLGLSQKLWLLLYTPEYTSCL